MTTDIDKPTAPHWLKPVLTTAAGTGTSMALIANLHEVMPFLREFGLGTVLTLMASFAVICIASFFAPLIRKVVSSHDLFINQAIASGQQAVVIMQTLSQTQQAQSDKLDQIHEAVQPRPSVRSRNMSCNGEGEHDPP